MNPARPIAREESLDVVRKCECIAIRKSLQCYRLGEGESRPDSNSAYPNPPANPFPGGHKFTAIPRIASCRPFPVYSQREPASGSRAILLGISVAPLAARILPVLIDRNATNSTPVKNLAGGATTYCEPASPHVGKITNKWRGQRAPSRHTRSVRVQPELVANALSRRPKSLHRRWTAKAKVPSREKEICPNRSWSESDLTERQLRRTCRRATHRQ